MPTSLLEAMSCGLYVIASRVGGTQDVVEDGVNGVLFESDNAGHLADKLASALSERNRWEEIGANARQTALGHADLGRVAERFDKLYTELVEEPS